MAHFTPEQLTQRFVFENRYRNIAFGLIGIGLVLLLAGIFFASQSDSSTGGHAAVVESTIHTVADTHGGEHSKGIGNRILSNLLLSSLYFFTITMGAIFFMVIHRVGNAGWQTAIRRVPEAISSYLPIGVISLSALFFFLHHIFEWAHHDLNDPLIEAKRAYLNEAFFIIRNLIFFGVWAGGAWYLRKLSIQQDGESDGVPLFRRIGTISAIYLIFYGISYCLFAVDWIKSLEPHWFSTIFGIYVFAGTMVSSLVTMYFITAFLKKQGYMQWVNDAHFHDLGKYAFGFTVFWGYIWVAQYLLIWYSNIPEEGIYYVKRYRVDDHAYLGYATFFYTNVIINFLLPFVALMTRNAKRTWVKWSSFRLNLGSGEGFRIPLGGFIPIGILMLYGHWHDLYLMIMPGAMGYNPGIGLVEIGFFVTFLGIFIYAVLNALTKANLAPLNHPYLEESIHHTTGPV